MSGQTKGSRLRGRETVDELRSSLGLFSFRGELGSSPAPGPCPQLGVRPGGIVEWLVAGEGAER